MKKQLLCVLMVFSIWIFTASTPAIATPPDITGKWYGTWTVPGDCLAGNCAIGYCGFSNIFSATFWDSPYGLLAIMYVPEFGLFDEYLPVTIEESPDGILVTIGVEGYSEIWGILDGKSLSGSFYANFGGDPPLIYNGNWQAEKYTGQEVFPGEAPGQLCDYLPPLYCIGDAEYCSELVPFEPSIGEGYIDQCNSSTAEEDQCYRYIRRDLMMLIKHATAKVACKSANWDYGNFSPLGLLDMSEADGATPGTSSVYLRHPYGTHEDGKDIDTAYYQLYATDNLARPMGVHHDGFYEAYHLTEPSYALDKWRTALFITYLAEHPLLRVIGVDGQIGPVLEGALDELVNIGWIDPDLTDSIPLAYEAEDTGMGWYYFHYHHMHISMNPVFDIVSSAEINPDTLNRKSEGATITTYIEFNGNIDVNQINVNGVALILDGHTMIYAQPQNIKISDYNQNGIEDLTVKFDRQKVLESIENGNVEVSIAGLIDDLFFQASDMIYVIGDSPPGLRQGEQQRHNPQVPFIRPGGRAHESTY